MLGKKQENDEAVETKCKSRFCSRTWCRIIVLKWLVGISETQESKNLSSLESRLHFLMIIETSQGRQKEGKIKGE